jgi:hypothetical protein
MGRPLSKSDLLIILAKDMGYTADVEGNIYKPDGKRIIGGVSKSGHKNFIPNVVPRAERSSVLAHRFIAYYFYGKEIFNHDLVRHLNDIPYDNRVENLKPGSYKENRADIPKRILSENAKRNTPGLIKRSRVLSDSDILEMRRLRGETNLSYAKLAGMFGVAAMTAYRAICKQSWRNV